MDCFVATLPCANALRLSQAMTAAGTTRVPHAFIHITKDWRMRIMGRYLLLWLLGIPLPILVLIYAFGGLNH